MSLHPVDALLDAATDVAVRQAWAALAAGGLPSQAAREGPTNAPHIMLSAAAGVPHLALDALGLLGRARPLDASIDTVRRWDPTARRAWPIGSKPTMEP